MQQRQSLQPRSSGKLPPWAEYVEGYLIPNLAGQGQGQAHVVLLAMHSVFVGLRLALPVTSSYD